MAAHLDDTVGAVLELHRELSEGVELGELGQAAVRHVARMMRGTAALWVVEADGQVAATAMAHPEPAVDRSLAQITGGRVSGPHRLVRSVMESGEQTRMSSSELEEASALMEPTYRRWFQQHPPRELVLQPLRMSGRSIGLLGVARDADQAPLDPGEHAFLVQIAQIVSVSLQTQLLAQAQEALLQQSRRNEERLDVLAHTDDLTGLPNRRGFVRALGELEQPLQAPVGLALLDLDDFKDVNDAFGHAAGDELLRAFSLRMSAALRPGALLARMGGDEFALLVRAPDRTSLDEELRQALRACPASLTVEDLDVPVRASVGVASRDRGDRVVLSDVLREADVAMYRAKRIGCGTVRFDPRVDTAALTRLHEADLLRRAVADRELTVHYQLLVPTAGGLATERAEALVRWPTPDGLRGPSSFLPLAHELGLMDQLTDLVLDLVVEQITAWRRTDREVSVAVNVPAQVLARPTLPEDVVRRLDQAGLPRDRLTIEVTENEIIDGRVRAAVARCRDLGLGVAIDDFGMGYSALSYLLDVPATELKIDRGLVGRVNAQPARRVLVEHCVALAHSLGVRVVAEGVETEAEASILREIGADWLQGFHLHRPGPAQDLPQPLSR